MQKSDEFSMIICDTLSVQIEFNFFGISSPIDPHFIHALSCGFWA